MKTKQKQSIFEDIKLFLEENNISYELYKYYQFEIYKDVFAILIDDDIMNANEEKINELFAKYPNSSRFVVPKSLQDYLQ